MKGQWIGTYKGSVEGNITVNIDEVGDHYEAVAYIKPNETNIPSTVAHILTVDKQLKQKVVARVNPIHPTAWYQCEWEEIKNLYPEGITHSKRADVTLILTDGKLHVDAISDIDVRFFSVLTKISDDKNSKISGKKMSWSEFKSHMSGFSESKFLFRGQKKKWKLRTSFHRRGRYRISEFTEKDVKQLHKRLTAITSHYFDLSIAEQNGAFINLIQHHGYPTPLLDWTYSPYVAAFFAFKDWPIGCSEDENCRIYLFDGEAWQKDFPQIKFLDPPFPHFSVLDFIGIENPRVVPQQSVTTVTNVDDIERHVLEGEAQSGNTYLLAFDISAEERDVAMRDLRFMGISAGSLFPSIDGVCEELRELYFDE
jgi:hypothetical protein